MVICDLKEPGTVGLEESRDTSQVEKSVKLALEEAVMGDGSHVETEGEAMVHLELPPREGLEQLTSRMDKEWAGGDMAPPQSDLSSDDADELDDALMREESLVDDIGLAVRRLWSVEGRPQRAALVPSWDDSREAAWLDHLRALQLLQQKEYTSPEQDLIDNELDRILDLIQTLRQPIQGIRELYELKKAYSHVDLTPYIATLRPNLQSCVRAGLKYEAIRDHLHAATELDSHIRPVTEDVATQTATPTPVASLTSWWNLLWLPGFLLAYVRARLKPKCFC